MFMWIYTYTAQCLETNETASEMDEELLRLVRGYHVSAQGLKILYDVGVVVASDFMHISDYDLACCGMNFEDRGKIGSIRQGQLIHFREGRGREEEENRGVGGGVNEGGRKEETAGGRRHVWGTDATNHTEVQMYLLPASSATQGKVLYFAVLMCVFTHTHVCAH